MMPTALIALGVMTLVVAGLAIIIGLLAANKPENVLEIATGLSILLLSLSAACIILGAIGAMGPFPIIGVVSLIAIIAALGGLMVGIGALAENYPAMESFLNTGIDLLNRIASGIGSFVGNLVGGFMAGASSNFAEIGRSLSDFMVSIKPFIDGANQIEESAINGVKALAQMILILTAANIMNGLTSWFTGGASMTDFANQLVPFGVAMVAFSRIVSGNIDEGAITASANAGKIMATMASEIPNTGGLLGWIVGNNNMDTFGTQLTAFGRAIVSYSGIVSGGIDQGAITASANAGTALIKMASDMPNSGGIVSWFTGDNKISTFGKQLMKFGEGLKGFSVEVSGMGPIDAGISAGKKVIQMSNTATAPGGLFSMNMTYFKSQLTTFGKAIRDFGTITAGVDGAKMKTTITQFSSTMTSLKTVSANGIDSLVTTFKNASPKLSNAINNMLDAMSKTIKKSKPTFNDDGKALVSAFSKGIDSEKNKPKTAISTVLNGVVAKAKSMDVYSDFKTIGSRCVDGFVKGISVNSYKASAQSRAMALAAKKAAENALGVKSPSRVFYSIGSFTVQGFVNSLRDNMSTVQTTASRLGDSAVNGLSRGLSGLSSLLGMDYNSQPTITPVLDLSDISSGVRALDGMLAIHPSMRTLADIGSINARMTLNQDTSNDDVVSAINKLNKTIKDSAGDNISLGNVTYDDGSNITSAVKDLVRAAKVERRT